MTDVSCVQVERETTYASVASQARPRIAPIPGGEDIEIGQVWVVLFGLLEFVWFRLYQMCLYPRFFRRRLGLFMVLTFAEVWGYCWWLFGG